MFSQVCVKNSVHRGGNWGRHPHLPNACWDTHTPGQTPPSPFPMPLKRTVRILLECILVRCVLFIVFRITEKNGSGTHSSIIHTVTIGTMLNCSGGNNGGGLKTVACRQTFRPFSHKFHIASTLTLFESKSVCVRSSRSIQCYRK